MSLNLSALISQNQVKETEKKPLASIIEQEKPKLNFSSLIKGAGEFFSKSPAYYAKKIAEGNLKNITTGASILKNIGQEIARNIGSAGITLTKPIAKKLYGQVVDEVDVPNSLQWLFKDEPIKSVETRIAEAELKVKDWGEKKQGTMLGDFAKNNYTGLAFAGVLGSVGLDLTPFGSFEKGATRTAIKAIKEVKTITGATKVLKKIGVADNIAKQFAKEATKVIDDKSARKLLIKVAELQKKSKVSPAIGKIIPKLVETEKTISKEVEPFIQEAKKYKYSSAKIGHQNIGTVGDFITNPKILKDLPVANKIKVVVVDVASPEFNSAKFSPKGQVKAFPLELGTEKGIRSTLIPETIISTNEPAILINKRWIEAVEKQGKNVNAELEKAISHEAVHAERFSKGRIMGEIAEISAEKIEKSVKETPNLLPVVIQGDTFTLGTSELIQPTKKELRAGLKTEIKATKQEIKNAKIATEKAAKLEVRQQKIREETINNINRFHGDTERIVKTLKSRNLADEDIANVILEDGTKLTDTIKVKRNPDHSLAAVIRKSDIDDIKKSYTAVIPESKWIKRNVAEKAVKTTADIAKLYELPAVFFERKGLQKLYDPIIEAGRGAEVLKNSFISRFKEAGLWKKQGWFTANRFNLSKDEAEIIGKYFLSRQGKEFGIKLTDLSENSQKFVKIFDDIIKDTEPRFFEVAKKNGKTPGVVKDYAPIMTKEDIELIDKAGAMDFIVRKHPSFFSLKERVKYAPKELYELDYRKVAARWLDGITQFLNVGEVSPELKYLIDSEQFKNVITKSDHAVISKWFQDIVNPSIPATAGGQAVDFVSRLLRKGSAVASLGLNYASVVKQALTQIPIAIIEKVAPKLKSDYAKAFDISVKDLPSITKRAGDIAIGDLQGKIGRIFTGTLTEFDRLNAQSSLNALLDKEYGKFLKQGAEITPEVQKFIEKTAQDRLDMWYGGFFKGQRPEAFRSSVGQFLNMFIYPLTSQFNGFYRHILQAKGATENVKSIAEVMAAATAIAYSETAITNLSWQWSDEKEMTEDVLQSLLGNIPIVSQISYAMMEDQQLQVSAGVSGITNLLKKIPQYTSGEKTGADVLFAGAEIFGLPKEIRRIKEGMEIIEGGGITDKEGKMLAPVKETSEIIRSILRGKYGSLAAQDWVRNIGEKSENRRWFVPQVEFLQNGDYDRKAELYRQFTPQEQKELRAYLSEGQQKKLDKALSQEQSKKALGDIFSNDVSDDKNKKSLTDIFK